MNFETHVNCMSPFSHEYVMWFTAVSVNIKNRTFNVKNMKFLYMFNFCTGSIDFTLNMFLMVTRRDHYTSVN